MNYKSYLYCKESQLPNSPTSPSVAVTDPIISLRAISAYTLNSYADVVKVGELSLMLLMTTCNEAVSVSCPSDTITLHVKDIGVPGISTS